MSEIWFAASIAATTAGGAPAGGIALPLASSFAVCPGTGAGAGSAGATGPLVAGSAGVERALTRSSSRELSELSASRRCLRAAARAASRCSRTALELASSSRRAAYPIASRLDPGAVGGELCDQRDALVAERSGALDHRRLIALEAVEVLGLHGEILEVRGVEQQGAKIRRTRLVERDQQVLELRPGPVQLLAELDQSLPAGLELGGRPVQLSLALGERSTDRVLFRAQLGNLADQSVDLAVVGLKLVSELRLAIPHLGELLRGALGVGGGRCVESQQRGKQNSRCEHGGDGTGTAKVALRSVEGARHADGPPIGRRTGRVTLAAHGQFARTY